MSKIKIRRFFSDDTKVLKNLFPDDWNFDFEKFIYNHIYGNYFYALTILSDDVPIGFGNIMMFGSIGWLGNIIVSKEFRGRGLGYNITKLLIGKSRKYGIRKYSLFATELGEPLYKKMGFKTVLNYEFYRNEDSVDLKINGKLRRANSSNLRSVCRIDFKTTSEVRGELLENNIKNAYLVLDDKNEIGGFLLPEFGEGLIIANDPESGIELLKQKIMLGKNLTVIPETNQMAKDFLENNGFKKVLSVPLMNMGEEYPCRYENIFSRATGYCG